MHTEALLKDHAGLNIFTQEWGVEQPKATVLLVHGLGEHSGRYAHVAARLNQAGYTLFGFDLPGHGKSGGPRGHISSNKYFADLISRLLTDASTRHSGLPLFLYGHSLGGNQVLYYTMTCRPHLAGVISTSPGLGTADPVPAWKTIMGKLLYSIAPATPLNNGLKATGLSRDQAIVSSYRRDPLVHSKVSVRLGLDSLNNGTWILANAGSFPSIPLLIMQGSADTVVDPARTRLFATSISGDVTYKEWEGLYHELHNEQHPEVLNTMVAWLDEQTTKTRR